MLSLLIRINKLFLFHRHPNSDSIYYSWSEESLQTHKDYITRKNENQLDASLHLCTLPHLHRPPRILGPGAILMHLTLLVLNTICPVLVNSVDPDQLASKEAN